jgi:hypothetical protein
MDTNQILLSNVLEMLETSEGTEKLANYGSEAIKLQIRELGFSRKLFSYKPVSRTEPNLQRRTDLDEVYLLVPIEPGAGAVTTNFRADAPSVWVKESRIELGFGKIEAVGFEKSETELWATMQDLMGTIKKYTVFDIQREEDSNTLAAFDQAVAMTGKYINSPTTTTLSKEILRDGRALLDADLLEAKTVLCDKDTMNDLMLWDSNSYGYGFVQSLVESDKIKKVSDLYGLNFITSIKTDLFRDVYYVADEVTYPEADHDDVFVETINTVDYYYTTDIRKAKVTNSKVEVYKEHRHLYVLPEREFLGDARTLIDLKFWAKKEKDKFKMGAYEVAGLFVLANGVVKITIGK